MCVRHLHIAFLNGLISIVRTNVTRYFITSGMTAMLICDVSRVLSHSAFLTVAYTKIYVCIALQGINQ